MIEKTQGYFEWEKHKKLLISKVVFSTALVKPAMSRALKAPSFRAAS